MTDKNDISICKSFNKKNRRIYILLIQLIISITVYLGLQFMFENADKLNGLTMI